MRTSPIQQGLWTLLAAGLLAVPLYILTAPSQTPPAPPAPASGAKEQAGRMMDCVLTIRCADMPETLEITCEGKPVFTLSDQEDASLLMEIDTALPLSGSRSIALTVKAAWKNRETDSPVTLSIEPSRLREQSATRWSSGPILNDIFSFSW